MLYLACVTQVPALAADVCLAWKPETTTAFDSLEKKRLRGDLLNVYKYLKGSYQDSQAFAVVPSARTRGKVHKLEHRRFHPNIRKHFFKV